MKLVHVTGPVIAALLASGCGANSSGASDPQRAAAQAEQERDEARRAREDADKARLEAKRATDEQREKERDAQVATQRAAQLELQAGRELPRQPATHAASGPGTTELQADTTAKGAIARSTVLFAANSAELSPATKAKLDDTARVLQGRAQMHNAVIEGYSDDAGADSANLQLSRKRAEAVAAYLEAKGVDRERISTKGMGSRNQVSREDTNRGEALNRRVEIVILPANPVRK
jgi:outer membrane protein OmpA-like peptidoglycan-associated protein